MSEEFTEELTKEEEKGLAGEEEVEQEAALEPEEPPAEEAPKEEEPPEEEPEEKTVPLAALHEERGRRQELQRSVEANEEKVRRMEERFQRLMEPEETPPDFDEDPAANLKFNQDQIARRQEELSEQQQKQEQRNQQITKEQQFVARYSSEAQQFAQTTPDFMDGYNHWQNSVAAELKAAGYEGQEISDQLRNFERNIAIKAMKDGVNSASRIYDIAKQRGYTAGKPSKATEGTRRDLSKIEAGQKAAKSLSSAGGDSPQQTTLESLAEMDDDDFDAWMIANPKGWEKLHRG